MALADETKSKIIFYLGHEGKIIVVGSNSYNSIIADRLDGLNTFIEDQVETLLSEIEAARVKLTELQSQGKLKQVGDIVFNVDSNDRTLKGDYKRLLRELANLLGIPLRGKSGMVGVCL